MQQFKYLNDELLKELCPSIGTRLNLKHNIQEFVTAHVSHLLLLNGSSAYVMFGVHFVGLCSGILEYKGISPHIRAVPGL